MEVRYKVWLKLTLWKSYICHFFKTFFALNPVHQNCFVYGQLGVFPLFLKRQERVIKFWLKLIRQGNTDSALQKLVYNEMVLINEKNPTAVTWVSLVKGLLFRIGMGNYWVSQYVADEGNFVSLFRQRIRDIFLQDWKAAVDLTSNNRIFKHIKVEFRFELYLNIPNKAFRIAVTKIRLSSHVFMIERARWNKRIPELNERVCEVCNVVEDEYHCLYICPRFTNERIGCVPDGVLLSNRTVYDFYKFLNCENERDLHKLGLLCYRVQKAYKRELFQNE